jgi:uncharacterized SAM-binding protein YcdF (DUF218 family)
MFFVLSKTLDALASPYTWGLALFALALVLGGKRRRASLIAGVLGLAVLLVFSAGGVAQSLWRTLESGAVKTARPDVIYDAVIVLSGMVEADSVETHHQPAYNDNVERLLTAFDLLRAGRVKNVLLSGGSGRMDRSGPVEADELARQLESWGVDRARIFEERESRNTRENAVESAKVVKKEGWQSLLLVTSAFHMPRALGCFTAAGLTVDTLPVDYRTGEHPAQGWFPRVGALDTSTGALREWLGRAVYRVSGYAR